MLLCMLHSRQLSKTSRSTSIPRDIAPIYLFIRIGAVIRDDIEKSLLRSSEFIQNSAKNAQVRRNERKRRLSNSLVSPRVTFLKL